MMDNTNGRVLLVIGLGVLALAALVLLALPVLGY